MNLIEQVIDLDGRATKGPWGANTWVNNDDGGWAAVGPHHEPQDGDDPDDLHNPGEPGSDCHERAEVDARLLSLYRTAAPKLARALDNTKKKLAVLERMSLGASGDLLREIIADIEKEIA